MAKGKGNKMIQIAPKDLAAGKDKAVAIAVLPERGALRVISGKRHVTLKGVDIEHYSGNRANRGTALPRGFQRVDKLECMSS